jgi:hypothetical protein
MRNSDKEYDVIERRHRAFTLLKECENDKVVLTRRVFFVPGWATEKSCLWINPFSPENISMSQWVERIVDNYEKKVHFLRFSRKESDNCVSFECFGKLLYSKIKPFLADKDEVFDMVGYSMGGLDICSSVISGDIPSRCVGKIITLGSPFRGDKWAEVLEDFNVFSWFLFGSWLLIRYLIYKLGGYTEANVYQLESLRPRGRYIKDLNTKEHRLRLLSEVEKLYILYSKNDKFVGNDARFDRKSIPEDFLKEKLEEISFEGTIHYGTMGLSQDPRVLLNVLEILSGRKIYKGGDVL